MEEFRLDLNNLLRLAFSEPVAWLSGDAHGDVPVNWVATTEVEIQSGDLLVIPASQFEAPVLAEAKHRGAVAALLLGETRKKIDPLPKDLPVALIAGERDARQAQRSLLTMIINQRGALMERGVRIHTQLSQMAAEGGGLDGLAQGIANISGRGVLVQDKRLNVLTQHPSSTLSAIWQDVLAQICAPEFLPESLRDRKRAGRQPTIQIQEIPGNLRRLITPIVVGEVARGYLSLVGPVGELDDLDRLVLEQGALVCAVEMARAKAVREAEKRFKGDLLNALLQDDLSPRDIRLWAQAMALDLEQAHVALRFAWDGPTPPSRRRLETLISGEVSRQRLTVVTNPMGGEVVCFCQVSSDSTRPKAAFALGEAVGEQGEQEYPQTPVRCGIGAPALEFSAWRTSFRQAGQALEMARRLGAREPLFFPDLSVYRLLLQLEHSPELISFQEEILGPLLAHESSDELISTLEAYFQHNNNVSQTAEALYIHRNTLVYRLERIANIANLDLDEPETRLAVQLALRIYRMGGMK